MHLTVSIPCYVYTSSFRPLFFVCQVLREGLFTIYDLCMSFDGPALSQLGALPRTQRL